LRPFRRRATRASRLTPHHAPNGACALPQGESGCLLDGHGRHAHTFPRRGMRPGHEGDGAPKDANLVARALRHAGASRRAVHGVYGSGPRLTIPATRRVASSQLLAGTPSGPGGSSGAARVPCCDKNRGRRTPSRLDARLAKRPSSGRGEPESNRTLKRGDKLLGANSNYSHARRCAGHPRLRGLASGQIVDGRDKPGHDKLGDATIDTN